MLYRLRNEVRWLRALNIAMVAALIVMGFFVFRTQSQGKRLSDRITTKDLVLTDSDGRARARLTVFPEGSGLQLYAPSGENRVQLSAGGEDASLNLYLPATAVREAASFNVFHNNVLLSSLRADVAGSRLEMHSGWSKGTAQLAIDGHSASLMLSGTEENVPKLSLAADKTRACTELSGAGESPAGGSFCVHSPGLPSLELVDTTGDRAVIGIPQEPELNPANGTAAALILKKKDKKIQVAPQ